MDDETVKTTSFCKVPLNIISKYGNELPFDIYLKLSESKYVKLVQKDGNVIDTVSKYNAKGVESVYTTKEDFATFINQLNNSFTSKFFDPNVSTEQSVSTLSDGYEVVQESLQKLGISQSTANFAKEITKQSISLISQQPNIFKFFQEFKSKCSEAYLLNMLVAYTTTCMLDTFDWTTHAIKEKMNLSVMLRDILLNKDDLIQLKEHRNNIGELSGKIIEHPRKMAEMIENDKNTFLPKEVAVIIEQHHESPDGKGFPRGIGHSKITVLSAIQIVGDDFIDRMVQFNFDLKMKNEILNALSTKYNQGNFRKAMDALKMMFHA